MIKNAVTSASVVGPQRDVAVGPSDAGALDKKLVEQLESLNLSKSGTQQIPLLQPPPASLKARKPNEIAVKNTNVMAAANRTSKDDHMMSLSEYIAKKSDNLPDTSSVFNQIWYQNAVVQNGNMPKVNNIAAASQENVSEFGQFRCNQPVQNGDASLYGNGSSYYSTTSLYASQLATYGSYGYRQYSEVPPESVYSEIPEYFYSQVPDETLRPHRPAPPSPLVVIGQPQSMQQIQRKLQVGRVSGFAV